MTRPLTIGLTGSVAAGKSAALTTLERLGVATISSDAIVHYLLGTSEVRDALRTRWGPDIVSDGEVDRGRVGQIVFADAGELRWLEALLHPLVRERTAEWMTGLPQGTEFAVVEVPLLFESGLGETFDTTIAITVSERLRQDRAEERGTALVSERDSHQLSQGQKAEQAEHVISNDGSLEDLESALAELLDAFRADQEASPPESLTS